MEIYPRFNVLDRDLNRVASRVSLRAAERIVVTLKWPRNVVACEPARFSLERSKVPARRPWILKDAARPAFRGAYASQELALRSMDNRVRHERGYPERIAIPVDEIRAAMMERAS